MSTRNNLRRYRSTKMRGRPITVSDAARRSGIPYGEIMRRIEAGELEAHDMLVVDEADFAVEIYGGARGRVADLLTRLGIDSSPEAMRRLGWVDDPADATPEMLAVLG